MKFVLAFVALFAFAYAVPVPNKDAQTLRYDNDHGVGGYSYAVETSNGIQQQEQAELRNFGPETSAIVVRGSYSFTADDGQVYTVNYIADENGFQPEAAHLPRA
ncbi:larval cuticle protein 65Ag1-like [Toxorhynchites rutilus septentrionalis]|uniref:larval cuticle protein 65Ag1-like n=1 Tax=Toxorhynchites rutilus septentrionalis TaxID=329112 RepID=UPI0024794FBA|nr:larval cuticle protein 65Ag1-like [Toxorhynchites rutilus septentrionalis]